MDTRDQNGAVFIRSPIQSKRCPKETRYDTMRCATPNSYAHHKAPASGINRSSDGRTSGRRTARNCDINDCDTTAVNTCSIKQKIVGVRIGVAAAAPSPLPPDQPLICALVAANDRRPVNTKRVISSSGESFETGLSSIERRHKWRSPTPTAQDDPSSGQSIDSVASRARCAKIRRSARANKSQRNGKTRPPLPPPLGRCDGGRRRNAQPQNAPHRSTYARTPPGARPGARREPSP
uniref:Uncharacterized protein n=1 Tax=Plectus sambesii TaxID=2011161 RepID=A0A914XN42_9BILA